MSKRINDYYENIWKDMEGLQMVDSLADICYKWATMIHKGRLLDIGCGDGTNALTLKKNGFKVYGCDISKKALEKAKKKGISIKKVDLNTVKKIPYNDNYFDVVWLTDVIEHVLWPDFLLYEINRVLKKNGLLILTTPNVSWYIIRIRLLFGHTLKDIHPEHIHWFNKRQLETSLVNNQFIIEKTYSYIRLIPYPLVKRFPALNLLNYIGRPSSLFSHSYAVLAHKK